MKHFTPLLLLLLIPTLVASSPVGQASTEGIAADDICGFSLKRLEAMERTEPEASTTIFVPTVLEGDLDRTGSRVAINADSDAIEACFEDWFADHPDSREDGRLNAELVISPEGSVGQAKYVENSFDVPAVEECILEQLERVEFPESDDGGTLEVRLKLRTLMPQKEMHIHPTKGPRPVDP